MCICRWVGLWPCLGAALAFEHQFIPTSPSDCLILTVLVCIFYLIYYGHPIWIIKLDLDQLRSYSYKSETQQRAVWTCDSAGTLPVPLSRVSSNSPVRQVKWLQKQEVMLQYSWKREVMCVCVSVCAWFEGLSENHERWYRSESERWALTEWKKQRRLLT